MTASHRTKVLVCGTAFGRYYLGAFRRPEFELELAGILARGSDRSRRCAEKYAVPLYRHPREVPSEVELACVVVGAGLNGGPGTRISLELLDQGMHVLQEHPLHPQELRDCVEAARRAGVTFHVNTHYVHLASVRRFIRAARRLLDRQAPLFVDVATGFTTGYTALDIAGHALGGFSPWHFDAYPAKAGQGPFRLVVGSIKGVPLTMRFQNEVHGRSRDNFSHALHRLSIGTEGGTLTLAETHGPVLWIPRSHMPEDIDELVEPGESRAVHLQYPSVAALGDSSAPTYQELLTRVWPDATARAMRQIVAAISSGTPAGQLQHWLSLSRVWQALVEELGGPSILTCDPPEILGPSELDGPL